MSCESRASKLMLRDGEIRGHSWAVAESEETDVDFGGKTEFGNESWETVTSLQSWVL